jgi:hypothetical protein
MLTIVGTNIGCGRTVSANCTATPHPNTSDEVLIEAISGGDRRAMNVLYARHSVRVYRFALRLVGNEATAEDVASEVFLDVWRKRYYSLGSTVSGPQISAAKKPSSISMFMACFPPHR